MADGSLLVYHERDALRHAEETQYTIEPGNVLLGVAEQWKLQPELLREALVGSFTVDADAEDLRLRLFEEGETSLVRLELAGSGGSVGKHVKSQHDVPLAAKTAQLDAIALVIGKFKIRGRVTNLERNHALFRE